MSSQSQSRKYEENYAVLERITESLNKDEIGIDDLVEKTREALDAARTCMDILNKQKGEFTKLEAQFSQLLQSSPGETPDDNPKPNGEPAPPEGQENHIGQDDPF
jgi:exodeoxyribonuclease VII small subunit